MPDKEFFDVLNKTEDDLVLDYRVVFGSEKGQRVLADILFNFCGFCGYIDTAGNTEAEAGSYNVGVSILLRLGIPRATSRDSLIKALLGVPVINQGGK